MADRIALDSENIQNAASELEAQLQEWNSIKAGIAEEVLMILARQQADAIEFFGYLIEDFFTSRSDKIGAIVENHISQLQLMLQGFTETDGSLAGKKREK